MKLLSCWNWKWHWPSDSGLPSLSLIVLLAVILLALSSTAPWIELDLVHIYKSKEKLWEFLGHLFAVPDWSYLPTVSVKIVETLEIAFLSTTFALTISLPVGILAARNLSPHPAVYHASRTLLIFMRSLPEMVWALVFVSAVGLGPLPGILALIFVNISFMAKLFAESFEVVDAKGIEGVLSTGAGWLQLINFAILPQSYPDLISITLYIFDNNVRAATIIGIVGGGGIGYELLMSFRLFNFNRLLIILGVIYLAVTGLDRISSLLRSRII